MAIVEGWLPPTRENYDTIMLLWQFAYPLMASAQWITSWYPMGKTSAPSIFNVPGRIAWMTMELPGPLIFAYTMRALLSSSPSSLHAASLGSIGIGTSGVTWADLAWQNKTLAGLFLLHYLYRAILYPLLQPSIAPIHILVWLCAVLFQACNATCLASWLCSYGSVSQSDWSSSSSPLSTPRFAVGLLVFFVGLAGNFFHDEELRQIRRRGAQPQNNYQMQTRSKTQNQSQMQTLRVRKYAIPEAGLFRSVLYPHYLCEWIEWLGFWIAAGAAGGGCAPARVFLQNEVLSMLPRAINGRKWYVAKFGEEKLAGRRAIIPGVL